jgi:curved DNA-binding protein
MSVEYKNYYDIMFVSKTSTEGEIKKAFRARARKYHPDVAQDKASAERQFKEINEANEVLSDPDKRRKYDELGANWNSAAQEAPQGSGGFRGKPEAGSEFHFDGTGFSDFFEQFFSSRNRPPVGFSRSREANREEADFAARGQDIEGDILVTLDEVLHGSTRLINLQRSHPRTGQSFAQTLRVKIPPGVREAQLIRLVGKGQEGVAGGESGHLYLRVKYAKHPEFSVRGGNLYHPLDLSPWEAVLGATIHIPTLDGPVALRIPAGTTAEREFRLCGMGLPQGSNERGALYAIVNIQVPTDMGPEQKALLEQLAAHSTFNPREKS